MPSKSIPTETQRRQTIRTAHPPLTASDVASVAIPRYVGRAIRKVPTCETDRSHDSTFLPGCMPPSHASLMLNNISRCSASSPDPASVSKKKRELARMYFRLQQLASPPAGGRRLQRVCPCRHDKRDYVSRNRELVARHRILATTDL